MNEIYSITTEAERSILAELAAEVKAHEVILEIGTLYGGTTAVLAKANPSAAVITIDTFEWTPPNMPKASFELASENLTEQGITNVTITQGDSRMIARNWARPISLLWIDGGHSFNYVYSDLYNFGKHAKVIALHDYGNPLWPTVKQAVEAFLSKMTEWKLYEVVDTVCVLRRGKHVSK